MNFNLKGVYNVSTTWEDNIGAHNLANGKGPIMSFRMKHLEIKYHWFREMIQTSVIEIVRIPTKEQRADIFTNGLTRFHFEHQMKLLMGC